MTDAPERIWVWPDYNDHYIPFKQDWTHGFWDSTDEDSLGTEYVRVDRIKAQAAEIESLQSDLAKAMLIIEAYSNDEGYIPKRVVHLWNALHCSNQEGICHCGDTVECSTAALTGAKP